MGLKLKDLNSIRFLSSVWVIVVASFTISVSINWANEQDYFSGLEAPISEKIVGDVNFDELKSKTKAITPVPGGVGPMTIACLLKNTLECFKAHQL